MEEILKAKTDVHYSTKITVMEKKTIVYDRRPIRYPTKTEQTPQ